MLFMNYLKRIYILLRALLPWSVPIKLVLGALATAVGSAGVIGFMSEYATYSYAMSYGFRPPVEGVPYLRPAVTLGSLVILTACLLAFVVSATALKGLQYWMIDMPRMFGKHFDRLTGSELELSIKNLPNAFRKYPFRLKMALHLGLGAFVAVFLVAIHFFFHKYELSIFAVAAGGFAHGVISSFLALSVNSWRWMAVLSALATFIICIVLLFTPSYYIKILQWTGFGGGIPLDVVLKQDQSQHKEYYLMLRTADSFMFYDRDASNFVEVPKDEVLLLRHDVGGLSSLMYALPDTAEPQEQSY